MDPPLFGYFCRSDNDFKDYIRISADNISQIFVTAVTNKPRRPV
jgi:hypothetical protein